VRKFRNIDNFTREYKVSGQTLRNDAINYYKTRQSPKLPISGLRDSKETENLYYNTTITRK